MVMILIDAGACNRDFTVISIMNDLNFAVTEVKDFKSHYKYNANYMHKKYIVFSVWTLTFYSLPTVPSKSAETNCQVL